MRSIKLLSIILTRILLLYVLLSFFLNNILIDSILQMVFTAAYLSVILCILFYKKFSLIITLFFSKNIFIYIIFLYIANIGVALYSANNYKELIHSERISNICIENDYKFIFFTQIPKIRITFSKNASSKELYYTSAKLFRLPITARLVYRNEYCGKNNVCPENSFKKSIEFHNDVYLYQLLSYTIFIFYIFFVIIHTIITREIYIIKSAPYFQIREANNVNTSFWISFFIVLSLLINLMHNLQYENTRKYFYSFPTIYDDWNSGYSYRYYKNLKVP